MKRVLVIQLRELGDSLLTTPAIRQLSRIHPGAELDVLCEQRTDALFRRNPHVTECFHLPRGASAAAFLRLGWELRKRRYDLAVDAQSLPKTALMLRLSGAPVRLGFRRRFLCNRACYTHPFGDGTTATEYSALTKLKLLQDSRVDLSDLELEFPISRRDQREADVFAAKWFRGPVAAIYAAGRSTRTFWPSDRFVEIAQRFVRWGFQPLLVYGPGEEEQNLAIASQIGGRVVAGYPVMGFPVLKGILGRCEVFVGNDGGPKHAARAAGIPTVTVFNGNPPVVWTDPTRRDQRFVAGHVSAAYRVPFEPEGCPGEYFPTLEGIPVDAVWRQVESLAAEGFFDRRAAA